MKFSILLFAALCSCSSPEYFKKTSIEKIVEGNIVLDGGSIELTVQTTTGQNKKIVMNNSGKSRKLYLNGIYIRKGDNRVGGLLKDLRDFFVKHTQPKESNSINKDGGFRS